MRLSLRCLEGLALGLEALDVPGKPQVPPYRCASVGMTPLLMMFEFFMRRIECACLL
jgi:hypothetical protein